MLRPGRAAPDRPAWKDNILFHEYFHGDNGAGLGASHQTGWTGIVADLIRRQRGATIPTLGELLERLASPYRSDRARTAGLREPRGGRPREWLVTDGLGGYAMGTVAGLRTRRYHGLLVAAVDGPSARMLGLAALDPVLVVGDARYRLATDEWASGAVDPAGTSSSSRSTLDRGVPRWRWQVGDVVLEREVAMAHGRCAVGVVHRLICADRPVASS